MCRSVPQTEATLTLTRTSVKPILGTATSRTSAPGFGSGFTTASMVSAIEATHLPFLRAGGCGVQQETHDFSIRAGSVMCSAEAPLGRASHAPYFSCPSLGTLSDFQRGPHMCFAK